MNKKEKISILGTNFHTCLRKCMDSKASCICWLSIDLLRGKKWRTFLKRFLGKEATLENCQEALRVTREDHHKGLERTSEMILFEIGLKMLDEQEWKVLNEYTYGIIKG